MTIHKDVTIFVTPTGELSLMRPAPKSIMGATGSIIAGVQLPFWVPLEAEPWLRETIWRACSGRYQQRAVART